MITANAETGPASGPRVTQWYRDTISCLQASMGSVLIHSGHVALDALGLHWEFRHLPGDVRSEEFYLPCGVPGDLAASLLPHHPVHSRWCHATVGDLTGLTSELAQGRLVVAVVDNFHLPFRPAFGDVHAAHLLTVSELDEAAGTVTVSDPMPPAFMGTIALEDFLRAWQSANPPDEQDAFFSDSPIGGRYLQIAVGDDFPSLDGALLTRALDHSMDLFHGEDPTVGLVGLARFSDDLARQTQAGNRQALREAYCFGWPMQAQASLHGELLRQWGAAEHLPVMREAGRSVESVAHAWTGVRVCAAHARSDPRAAHTELVGHLRALRRAHETALERLAEARELL